MIAELLGLDQGSYRREVFEVLAIYIEYLRGNQRELLADIKFLPRAMPIFMRGAYLRTPLEGKDRDFIRFLDESIQKFFAGSSERVAAVFLGKEKEFSTEVGPVKFYVGRGYLLVDFEDAHLYSRYMPPE